MDEKKETWVPEAFKAGWEQAVECYQLIKEGNGRIVFKQVGGEQVCYTERRSKAETWEETMNRKKSIVIGDYKVQQPVENHVSVVWMPGSQMVFFSQADHWCSEDELKEIFANYMKISGGDGNGQL